MCNVIYFKFSHGNVYNRSMGKSLNHVGILNNVIKAAADRENLALSDYFVIL